MADYIKKSDAIEFAKNCIAILFKDDEVDFDKEICKVPSADVSEVRHGKWLWDGYVYDAPYACSCCSTLMNYESNFCPNCGSYNGGKNGT